MMTIVKLGMFRIVHQLKVFYLVIGNVMIFMMHDFSRILKFSSEMLFHDPSVFRNLSPIFKYNLIPFFVKSTCSGCSHKKLIWTSSSLKSFKMFLAKTMSFMHSSAFWKLTFDSPCPTIYFSHVLDYRWKLKTCQLWSLANA